MSVEVSSRYLQSGSAGDLSMRRSVRNAWVGSLLLSALPLLDGPVAHAANDIADLSLDALLSTEVEVTTRSTGLSARESPGIVSVLTREEIRTSGARDLQELLRLVPGVDFGLDITGVTGVGFRVNWGHEGKVLLLIDGLETNETLYGTTQLNSHYPADIIERVEIIRGPGSAMYGGTAELAVINVVTRGAAGFDEEGAELRLVAGKSRADVPTTNVIVNAAERIKDATVSASGYYGRSVQSARPYVDAAGVALSLESGARINTAGAVLGLRTDYAQIKILLDRFEVIAPAGFGEDIGPAPYDVDFYQLQIDGQLMLRPTGTLTLTPRANYRRGQPWTFTVAGVPEWRADTERFTLGLSTHWQAPLEFDVLGGVEGYLDVAEYETEPPDGGSPRWEFWNVAAFTQVLNRNPIINVAVGARFEHHEIFGSSFVPRLALTRLFDKLHLKLLYSRSFRAPAIENLALSDGTVRPERTAVLEGEIGYQLSQNLYVSANVFDILIKRPIVYFLGDGEAGIEAERYQNFPQTGTQGVELETRAVFSALSATLGYSFYRTDERNEVPLYEVDANRTLLLGFPAHKVTLNTQFRPLPNLVINPWLVWTSARYGHVDVDAGADRLPQLMLLNLFTSLRNVAGVEGLSLGAGVSNLLDTEVNYVQPYAGGHAPLPGGTREVMVRAGYLLDF